MSRSLRPRTSRPNYATLLNIDDDVVGEDAGKTIMEEEDSGSDFAPEVGPGSPVDKDEDASDASNLSEEKEGSTFDDGEEDEEVSFSTIRSKSKASNKNIAGISRSASQTAPGLARLSNRQPHALPLPSVNHRHRSIPLYHRPGRVERLVSRPLPFFSQSVIPTNNATSSEQVLNRVNKALGFNAGPGPLWELLEDRMWYKEAPINSSEYREALKRPKVYTEVCVRDGWQRLATEDARAYLPVADACDNNVRPLPSLTCLFGPYDNQRAVELEMFKSIAISNFFPNSPAHVFNAGAPVWALDWCPIHTVERDTINNKQFIAVSPLTSSESAPKIGARSAGPACIQIWSLNRSPIQSTGGSGIMRCEMVLCVDIGPAHELKWCPLPSHDDLSDDYDGPLPRKIGILAGTFHDGSFSAFVVPYPPDVGLAADSSDGPIFIKLSEPLFHIHLEDTTCWTLDWANSEVVAIGCTNGSIAVYNLRSCIEGNIADPLPTHYLPVHQSAIRAIAWINAPPAKPDGSFSLSADPCIIASGGHDGVECVTDIRDPGGNVINRTRDVIPCMTFSPYQGGPVTIDHENIVKAYSLSPLMLGRGHILLDPDGPSWSLNASAYHPQLAVGCSDGSCSTTNMSRSTRRGNVVPFFVHKIYQLDYSQGNNQFRMLEHFLPQETQDRPSAARAKKETPKPGGTGAWPAAVGVTRVVWNSGNGLSGSSWLASTTASGLCRVDWLEGCWFRNRVPYGTIPIIRGEEEGADSTDEDDE